MACSAYLAVALPNPDSRVDTYVDPSEAPRRSTACHRRLVSQPSALSSRLLSHPVLTPVLPYVTIVATRPVTSRASTWNMKPANL
jgi:hypothetical protein